MSGGTISHWAAVERWSPTLFLAGGLLLVGHAAVQGLTAFTTVQPPPDVFAPSGHLVALAGLFGLYPVVADRTPRLSRAAVAVGGATLVGWAGLTVAQGLTAVGRAGAVPDLLPGGAVVLLPVGTILTYALFGAATLGLGEGSRTVGALVLAPAALIVVLLVAAVTTGAGAVAGLVIGGGLALSMLALGYRLHTWDRPDGDALSVAGATAG